MCTMVTGPTINITIVNQTAIAISYGGNATAGNRFRRNWPDLGTGRSRATA